MWLDTWFPTVTLHGKCHGDRKGILRSRQSDLGPVTGLAGWEWQGVTPSWCVLCKASPFSG